MTSVQKAISFLLLPIIFCSCKKGEKIHQVTVAEFESFVESTQYVTDAEQFGWSIIQENIYDFHIEDDINWKIPDGFSTPKPTDPVTQISFNDAHAFAKWDNSRIPTYEEYWALIEGDSRPININNNGILPIEQVNIVGNVWEITQKDKNGQIRLAGGSYLCNTRSCDGSNPDRVLYVDPLTGNTHIGFAVIK